MAGFRVKGNEGKDGKAPGEPTPQPTRIQRVARLVGEAMLPPKGAMTWTSLVEHEGRRLEGLEASVLQIYQGMITPADDARVEELRAQLGLYQERDRIVRDIDLLVDTAAQVIEITSLPDTTSLSEVSPDELAKLPRETRKLLRQMSGTDDYRFVQRKAANAGTQLRLHEQDISNETLEARILRDGLVKRAVMSRVLQTVIDSPLLSSVTDLGALIFYGGGLAGNTHLIMRNTVAERISGFTPEMKGQVEVIQDELLRHAYGAFPREGREERPEGYVSEAISSMRVEVEPIIFGGKLIGTFQYVAKENADPAAVKMLTYILGRVDSMSTQLDRAHAPSRQREPTFSPFATHDYLKEKAAFAPDAKATVLFGDEAYTVDNMLTFVRDVNATIDVYFKNKEGETTFGDDTKAIVKMAWSYLSAAIQAPGVLAEFNVHIADMLNRRRALTHDASEEILPLDVADKSIFGYADLGSEILRGELTTHASQYRESTFSPTQFSEGQFFDGQYVASDVARTLGIDPTKDTNWDVSDPAQLAQYLKAGKGTKDETQTALLADRLLRFMDSSSNPTEARNAQHRLSKGSILNLLTNALEGAVLYALEYRRSLEQIRQEDAGTTMSIHASEQMSPLELDAQQTLRARSSALVTLAAFGYDEQEYRS